MNQPMFWNRPRLSDVARELAAVLLAPGPTPQQWAERRETFAKLLEKSSQDEVDKAAAVLTPVVAQAGAERVGAAAVLVGALVEHGADAINGGAVIVARMQSTLDAAPAADPSAVTSVRALCAAALTCLRRSKELRKQTGSREVIKRSLDRFAAELAEASFLQDLLSVLDDEELVVLHVEPPLGFQVRISGIADNFQLHTLLCELSYAAEEMASLTARLQALK
jgi:hypothetical protein